MSLFGGVSLFQPGQSVLGLTGGLGSASSPLGTSLPSSSPISSLLGSPVSAGGPVSLPGAPPRQQGSESLEALMGMLTSMLMSLLQNGSSPTAQPPILGGIPSSGGTPALGGMPGQGGEKASEKEAEAAKKAKEEEAEAAKKAQERQAEEAKEGKKCNKGGGGNPAPAPVPSAPMAPAPVGLTAPPVSAPVTVAPSTTGPLDSPDKLLQEIRNFNSRNAGIVGTPQGSQALAQFLNQRFTESRFTPQGNGLLYPLGGRNFFVEASGATPPRAA